MSARHFTKRQMRQFDTLELERATAAVSRFLPAIFGQRPGCPLARVRRATVYCWMANAAFEAAMRGRR